MPLFITSNFPPPLEDKEFEEMVRDLFASHWNDPNTQIFGRSGQGQKGVDIYGQPNQAGLWFGIQCKERKTGKLSRKDLEKEINLARSFHKKLDTYIFAITGSRDTKLQQIVDDLNETETQKGGFKVQILFWEDLCSLLSENSRIIRKYYPQYFSPETDQKDYVLSPLVDHPEEITPESPMLVGLVIDFSRSMVKTIEENPGLRNDDLKEAVSLVVEKAAAYCKTPEAEEVLPKFALFAYGFGLADLRRRVNNVIGRLLGTTSTASYHQVPSTPVRDLFAEVAAKNSLPFTPNIAVLHRSWGFYKKSIENQLLDIGFGPSNLYQTLCAVRDRLQKELERPYFKHPLIIVVSDGQVAENDLEGLKTITKQIQDLGAQIMYCYVGKRNITKPKTFYAEPGKQWSKELHELFMLSSIFVDANPLLHNIANEAKQKGWQVPERARLFMQINHQEMLDELIEILLSSLKD